ncbi:MAG: polysaccharide export protein EpsE [Paucibacter sp.]|nr:polysaccharide export protein EpsE [Roseateles sp.]
MNKRLLPALLALVGVLGAMPAVQAADAGGAGATTTSPEYRLSGGDVIRITVFQNPDMTLETRVSESGTVTFPLLGAVKIGGLSISAAESLIASGLRSGDYVKNPQVLITMLSVKGNQASVLGQVNRPGRYPIDVTDMHVSDLLANAGGAAPTGADVVVLSGTRDGKPYRVEIDLPSLFAPGGRAQDVIILNGDVLWVDRSPLVYIYGEVQRPGAMRLERGMTVMQALASGGGLTQRGTERGVRVNRKNAAGKVESVQLGMDGALQDGDVVYVRESLF